MDENFIKNEKAILLSKFLWLISLGLPAITTDEILSGWNVLVLGTLVGWLVGVFQAFSNITYLISLAMLRQNRNPFKLSIFTFVVGVSSFALDKVKLIDLSVPFYTHIESWGWGAIVWITAYFIIMIVAIANQYPEHYKLIKKALLIIPVVWLAILIFGRYQYAQANMEEKERMFAFEQGWFTAFVAEPLSHIPYNPIDVELSPGDLIELKGTLVEDYSLELTDGEFEIYTPPNFIYNHLFYSKFNDGVLARNLGKDQKPSMSLSFYQQNTQSGVQLVDEKTQEIVWYAPLIMRSNKNRTYQYPDYEFFNLYSPIGNKPFKVANLADNKITLDKIDFQIIATDLEEYNKYKVSMPGYSEFYVYYEEDRDKQIFSIFYNIDAKLLMLTVTPEKAFFFDLNNDTVSQKFTAEPSLDADIDSFELIKLNDETKRRSKVLLRSEDGTESILTEW